MNASEKRDLLKTMSGRIDDIQFALNQLSEDLADLEDAPDTPAPKMEQIERLYREARRAQKDGRRRIADMCFEDLDYIFDNK